MTNDDKQLLKRIIANQVVLYREIEKIKEKLRNSSSMKGYGSTIKELQRESDKVLAEMDSLQG